MRQLVGLLAVGAGAWFLYSRYGGGASGAGAGAGGGSGASGGSSSGGGSGASSGGSSSGSGSGTGTSGGSSSSGGTQQTLPIATAVPLAAAGNLEWAQVLSDKGIRYSVDQWNYYRVAGGKNPLTTDEMDILLTGIPDRSQLMTANEYLTHLQDLNVTAWHTN